MVPTGVLGLEVRVRAWVPMDDEHTLAISIARSPQGVRSAGRQVVRPPETLPNTTDWYGRFRCVANGHTKEAVSWRVERGTAWSLAYTGDTPDEPAVAELARGVDLFVAECSFPEEEAVPNHLTPTQAAGLAARAGTRTLLLTHFYPSMEPERARERAARVFEGPIELARDGSVHALGR